MSIYMLQFFFKKLDEFKQMSSDIHTGKNCKKLKRRKIFCPL